MLKPLLVRDFEILQTSEYPTAHVIVFASFIRQTIITTPSIQAIIKAIPERIGTPAFTLSLKDSFSNIVFHLFSSVVISSAKVESKVGEHKQISGMFVLYSIVNYIFRVQAIEDLYP